MTDSLHDYGNDYIDEEELQLFYGPEEEDYPDGDYEPDPDAQLEEYHWRLSAQ